MSSSHQIDQSPTSGAEEGVSAAPTTQGGGSLASGLRLFASVSRMHIVVIAALGTFTFGWIFTGRHLWLLPAISGLDWFLVNLLNRVVDQKEDQLNAIIGTDFVARHRRAILWGGFATLVLSFPLIFLYAAALTPFRAAYHLLGLTYNWPLLPGRRRIKQLYFFKNTASATGFLLTVFCYPLALAWRDGQLQLAPGITITTIVLAALFFFAFELSYEVIYDLRDAPGDKAAGVRSFPVVHGVRGAVRLVDGLIAAAVLFLVLGYAARLVPWHLFIMVCAPLIQLVVYKRALRRGITARDCIGLTWLGATLLFTYHVWIALGLPGAAIG